MSKRHDGHYRIQSIAEEDAKTSTFYLLSKIGDQVLQRDCLGDKLVLTSIWAEKIVIVFGVRAHNLSIIISLQQLFTDGAS